MKSYKLKKELKKAGAAGDEIQELMALSDKLDRIKVPHLRQHVKEEIAEQIGFKSGKLHFRPKFILAGSALAAVAIVVIFSQGAAPSSPFYEVKKVTNFWHHQTPQQKYQNPVMPQNMNHLPTIAPIQTPPPSNNGGSADQSQNNSANENHEQLYIHHEYHQSNTGDNAQRSDQDNRHPGIFRQIFDSF